MLLKFGLAYNFFVSALRNIRMLMEYGADAAGKIDSGNGNIYIKGGIASKTRLFITQ